MKNQQILRLLLQERVQRALSVNEISMLSECKKIGLSPKTVYDFANYQRDFVRNATANKLYLATKAILS